MARTQEERRVAGLRQQRCPESVHAFACGQCSKVYFTEGEARECCACDSCGTKFPHKDFNEYRCGHCQRPDRVKWLKDRIASDEDRLLSLRREIDGYKKSLVDMLVTPRPVKGSAQEK